MTVPAGSIGLPTSGATVVSATLVADTDSGNQNGEYCKVLGTIHPVDFNAPDIRAEVDLPTNFNGKAIHFGGGGFDGTIADTEGSPADGFLSGAEPAGVSTPLHRGYVTVGSDSGHEANALDGSFATNDEHSPTTQATTSRRRMTSQPKSQRQDMARTSCTVILLVVRAADDKV
jgi:feruloyl esterase